MARADAFYDEIGERLARLEAQHFDPDDSNVPDPVEWAERVSGMPLDPWQRAFLTSDETDVLMNCARQTGKSHAVSLRSAYRFKWRRNNVGVLAPTLRQATIIFRRARTWLMNDNTEMARVTANTIESVHGNLFTAFPGDRPDLAIRGDTLDDMIVDEASRIKDDLIVAATPSTSTRRGATITYLSTPAGKTGAFWRAWDKEDWWQHFTVKAEDCPRIPKAFLQRERKRLGPLYAQEYECEFLDAPDGMFNAADLDRLFQREHSYDLNGGVDLPQREAIW